MNIIPHDTHTPMDKLERERERERESEASPSLAANHGTPRTQEPIRAQCLAYIKSEGR